MEPITMALMAGTAGANFLTGARANRNAEESLAFQKWLANEEMRMGQASRTDAMGNTVRYDKALNKWVTDLTPFQNQLSKAGEHEQYLNLVNDAARNRQVRERAFQRGSDAGEDYNRELAGYRYNQGPGEDAIRGQLTDLILRSRQGQNGGGGNPNNFIRQRGNLPVVSSSKGPSSGVSDVASAMLEARQGALGERGQRDQQRSSRYLPAMQHFAATMDAGGGAPVKFPDFSYLDKTQSGAADDALKAFGQAGKGVESAYTNLTNASKLSQINPAQYATFLRGGTTAKGGVSPIASGTSVDNRSIDDIINDYNF
jgi:hypothetical protein